MIPTIPGNDLPNGSYQLCTSTVNDCTRCHISIYLVFNIIDRHFPTRLKNDNKRKETKKEEGETRELSVVAEQSQSKVNYLSYSRISIL